MEQTQSKCLQRDRLIRLKPTDLEELVALQKTVVVQGAEASGYKIPNSPIKMELYIQEKPNQRGSGLTGDRQKDYDHILKSLELPISLAQQVPVGWQPGRLNITLQGIEVKM